MGGCAAHRRRGGARRPTLSYHYDIFISYTRRGEAGEWVRNHFKPRLEGWLEQAMEVAPSIFWDRDIESGQVWPDALREALSRSRIIVPVLSHPYFRSRWCLAELNTMIARAQVLGPNGVPTERIIRPVRFYGDGFPEPMGQMQYEDMQEWAVPQRVFETTAPYVDFVRAVQTFAGKVAGCLPQAPPWDANWPVRMPEPAPLATIEVPRL
jgi:hypothetical protein